MNRLLDAFQVRRNQAQSDTKRIATDSAIARVFAMTAEQCYALVQTALGALRASPPDPRHFSDPLVRAAWGALSPTQRDQAMSELRSIIAGQRKLASAISLRDLDRGVKHAASEIAAARQQVSQGDSEALTLDPDAPRECARQFVEHCATSTSLGVRLPLIRYWRERWCAWNSPCYAQIPTEVMIGYLYDFMEEAVAAGSRGELTPIDPDKNLVENIRHALISLVFIDSVMSLMWLDDSTGDQPDPSDLIVFGNGYLSVTRWLAGHPAAFIPPTPALFSVSALPFSYDPNAKCPEFERFIDQVFEGDQDRINALRIWGGYLLTSDTTLQVILVLIGKSRSGKGTLIRILTALLGKDNVSTPKLSSLKGDFGLAVLDGKKFAAVTDCHFVGKDALEAVEVLLAISGEDAVDINRKHRDVINGLRLSVRFALVMNEMVNLPDTTAALLNRLEFLPFNMSFLGQEDTMLSKRIIENEMPGIANWFLEGLRVLRHTRDHARSQGVSDGKLIRPLLRTPAGEAMREQFRRLSSPIFGFVDDSCDLSPEFTVIKSDLYRRYMDWCKESGHFPCATGKFFSDLYAIVQNIEDFRPQAVQGQRPHMLRGIRLNPSGIDGIFDAYERSPGSPP